MQRLRATITKRLKSCQKCILTVLHSGAFAQQKAVLMGQFSQSKLVPTHVKGFKRATVVDWLRGQIKAPVLTGLPFGHVDTKVLLPVGAKVDLVTAARDALMVWGHI